METAPGAQWAPDGQPGQFGGQAAGYKVCSGTVSAYAKPSVLDGENPPIPRAAHEKIAADLAFELGLPLPPVILHRWQQLPAGNQPFVALSLWPFLTVHKWQHIEAAGEPLLSTMKLELREASSVLVPFDTWLDNRDRPNNGNLLVSNDRTGHMSVAYIDYAYSMAHGWRDGKYQQVTVCQIYPTDQKDADVTAMADVLSKIEELDAQRVRDIVSRIPSEFLRPADSDLIVDGLLHRQVHLRPALKAIYGGLA